MLKIQSKGGCWWGRWGGAHRACEQAARPRRRVAAFTQNLLAEQFQQVDLQPPGGGNGTARGHTTGGRESSCDLDSHAHSH